MTTFQRIVFFGSLFLVIRCAKSCMDESRNTKSVEKHLPVVKDMPKLEERDTLPKRKFPDRYDTTSSGMNDDELLERKYNRDAMDKLPKETLDPDDEFYKEYYTP